MVYRFMVCFGIFCQQPTDSSVGNLREAKFQTDSSVYNLKSIFLLLGVTWLFTVLNR